MITFFNKIGNSWIAKIICAALGISMMAFWGLGGLSSGFSGNDHKAITVGSDVVTVNQINQIFNRERSKIEALTRNSLSPQKAIEMGFLDHAIQQAINDKLFEKIINEIGLTASEKAVRRYVENNPIFQDNLGNFDTKLFYAYLSQLKMNQAELALQLKNELAQKHLFNAISKTIYPNSSFVKSLTDVQKEQRSVSAYLLKPQNIVLDTPTETALKEYYDAYQEDFSIPEYRKIQLTFISPTHFSDDKTSYEKLEQAVHNLEDLLGEGISLKNAAKKLALPQPITITIDVNGNNQNGHLADSKLKENPILQEIFTLLPGESTSIDNYLDGFIVAELEKIIPPSFQKYENVKDQVRSLWEKEQQKEKLPQLAETIINNLTQNKNWGKYVPVHETISRVKSEKFPTSLLGQIYTQKLGYKNAQAYPINNEIWIVVVNQKIQNTTPSTEEEKLLTLQLYTQDLSKAINQAYAAKFNVKIHEKNIKDFFENYTKNNDE